jgi:RHS repeat-associated protein
MRGLALWRRLMLPFGGRRRGPVIVAAVLAVAIPALAGASVSIAAPSPQPPPVSATTDPLGPGDAPRSDEQPTAGADSCTGSASQQDPSAGSGVAPAPGEPSGGPAAGDPIAPECMSLSGTLTLSANPNPTTPNTWITMSWSVSPGDDCGDNLGHGQTGHGLTFDWFVESSFTWTVSCASSGTKHLWIGAQNNPSGWFDDVNANGHATGWTCDADDFNAQLTVHFYADGYPGAGGTWVGWTTASQHWPSVAGQCGNNPWHGFIFAVPDSLRDGQSHALYAYAVNVGSGNDVWLGGTPQPFTLIRSVAAPTVSPPGPVSDGTWLQTTQGTWTGNPSQLEWDYEWLRNGVPIANATDTFYQVSELDRGKSIKSRVTACIPGSCAVSESSNAVAVNPGHQPAASQLAPADLAVLPTANPLLSAVISDADGDELDVLYQVASDPGFSTLVATSGWLPHATQDTTVASTSNWTVPPGALKDGRTYWWRFWVTDYLEGPTVPAARRFDVRLPKLGVRDFWPMWSRGPVSVNLVTGNLVVSVPGPSYPTAVGSMGASATYNVRDAGNRDLGQGWTLAAGDGLGSPPTKLVDHNLLSGAEQYDAIERVSADGSSDFYTRVGTTNTYVSAPGDGSQLTRGDNGSWTLVDPDGAIYLFATTHSNGAYPLVSAELGGADAGKGVLHYTFQPVAGSADPLRVTQIRDSVQGQPPNRALTFAWNSLNPGGCPTAIVCMTGPDGVTWRYVADAAGRLSRVNNGTRDILALTYDPATGRLVKIQNANDLDPAGAGPGYLPSHALNIAYDGSGRVSSVSEGPVSPTSAFSTWSFAYTPGVVPVTRPTQATHGAMAQGTVRSADGYAEVTPPRQQGLPSPLRSRVYYDSLARPLEQIDLRGNVTSSQYNDKDQILWTEDEQGQPTDHAYDSVNDVLTSVTGPDPDGPGPLGRPVTSHRYDEVAIGSSGAEGSKLQGLQASYYANRNLAGRPQLRRTDASINFQWADGTGPLPGVTDNFSIRWTGNLHVPTGAGGLYTLTTVADDGTRLIVDGVVAIDNWRDQGPTAVSSQPIQLNQGLHKISLEYYEHLVSGQVQLLWACSGCPSVVIPSSNLRPAWMNQTSTISPTGRVSFSHVADPTKGSPDYTLQRVNNTNLITSFAYDDYGRVTQKVMPKGNAARTIDANGDLLGTADTRYATTWSYYAPADTAVTPAHGTCGSASPNQGALLRQMATYGLAPVTHVYDSAGRSVKTARGAGDTVRCYDAEGRLKSEQAPGETQPTTYLYDPAGQVRTVTDASGTLTSEYDEAGRMKRSIDSFGAEASFAYDVEGNQITRTAKASSSGTAYTTSYSYDDLGRLVGLSDPASPPRTYAFFYDARDALRATQYPNGTFSWNDYNQAGWLTATYNRHGTLTAPLPGTVPADASPIVDSAYTYSLEGQRTQETRTGGGLATETTTYVYDDLGRLERVTLSDGTSRRYCFDRDSNRTEITAAATTACGSGNPVATYAYDPNLTPGVDQLSSVTQGGQTRTFTYNADGEATQRGSDTLQWDGRGRLKGGTFAGRSMTYSFDAAGFRRQRTASATSGYRSEVLADSPASYWRLGEASGTAMVDDRSQNPGTYLNGVTLQSPGALASDANTAASFDVVDDHASVSNAAGLNPSSQITLEAWIKPRSGSFGKQKPVLLKSFTSHNLPFYQYGLFLNNAAASPKLIRFSLALNGQHTNLDVPNSGWQFGVWQHLAATYDGQTMRVYLNGTAVGSRSATGAISAYATPLLVSAYQNLAKSSSYLFAGELDELAVYPAALSQARIQAHYTAATSTSSTVRYLLGGLFETTSSGTVTLADVDGPAGDLAHYAGPPATGTTASHLYYNGHGDLVATANQAGTRTDAYTHDPFGAPLQPQPADSTVERYTGRWDKKLDTTSGLIEMGARPYDPILGRFLAVDPVDGGALNNYDYALQDPVNQYDLDGRCVGPLAGVCLRLFARPLVTRLILAFGANAVAAERLFVRRATETVFKNPRALQKLSPEDSGRLISRLADSNTFRVTNLGRRSRNPNAGFILREVNPVTGRDTGRMIQWHSGSSRHPTLGAYWKVSSPKGGIDRFSWRSR